MKLLITVVCSSLLLIAPYSFGASTDAGSDDTAAVRSFVQGFYDWYVPKALDPKGEVASDLALKQKGAFFSTRLAQALKDDSAAAAKSPDEIVGLDFDPFLASQDPCDKYVTGAVTQVGIHFQVAVFGICSGKKNDKPDVIVEVIRQGTSCIFVNFLYPGQGDLLSTLKLLQQERDKPAG
jgi:hypothetical protein